jgi:hypothetical protein
MTDHELISAMYDEVGVITYCGGDGAGDHEIALAFVLFVKALPDTWIHPDDIRGNTSTSPSWSALALEYVFSDRSQEDHVEIVIQFFATLTPAQRARAWSGVRAQVTTSGLAGSDREKPILDALAERIDLST